MDTFQEECDSLREQIYGKDWKHKKQLKAELKMKKRDHAHKIEYDRQKKRREENQRFSEKMLRFAMGALPLGIILILAGVRIGVGGMVFVGLGFVFVSLLIVSVECGLQF